MIVGLTILIPKSEFVSYVILYIDFDVVSTACCVTIALLHVLFVQ